MSAERTPEATVRAALAEHGKLSIDVDGLGVDDSLFDAGLTSHATVNVMLSIEDAYDVEFPVKFLKRSTFETIGRMREALEEMLAG